MVVYHSSDLKTFWFPRSVLAANPAASQLGLALRILLTGYVRLLRRLGCPYVCLAERKHDMIAIQLGSDSFDVLDAVDFIDGGCRLLCELFPQDLQIVEMDSFGCNCA